MFGPHFVLSAHAYPGLIRGHGSIVGMVFFRAESSDLLHMGVYTGMGVILVWALFWYGRYFGMGVITGEYGN